MEERLDFGGASPSPLIMALARKGVLEETGRIRKIQDVSITEIQRMSTSERLRTMEALWDALCHEPVEPDSPAWHQEVLDERRHRIEKGEAQFVSLSEAKRRLQA